MFNVVGSTITLSIGDTGAIKISVDGYTFGENDRALFSIRASNGQVVKQRAYALENNEFTVTFFNSDTDKLGAGAYSWDVRYVINPYYDDAGNIIDGDQVLTPNTPMTVQLLNVVGDI